MKKSILLFVLFFNSFNLFAQLKTDAVSIFKMQLFMDNKNVEFRGMDSIVVKNDSLYKAYSSAVDIRLDTLKIAGSWEIAKYVFASNYQFYGLLIYDTIKNKFTNNIIYKRKLNNDEEQFFMLSGGYILAINKETGLSYKLKGFNGNDFLGLLSDFKELYKKRNGQKISTKQFLKRCKVPGLDFECLYEGLTAHEINRERYPCLKRVSDPVWIR